MKFVSFNNYATGATNEVETQVLWKGKQVLLHLWHPSCCSSYKSDDMSKNECGKDKWNIPAFIYDTDIPKG